MNNSFIAAMTTASSEIHTTTETIEISLPTKIVPPVAIVILLITMLVVSLLLFIYWKRRQSSLPHLDKNHKESEENSYSSSKNSRDSSPKGGDSFDPLYDEIKLKVSSHLKEPIIKENYKSCKDEDELDDPHYSTVYSKFDDQQGQIKEEICSGFDHKKSHISCEEIKDHLCDNTPIDCTNDGKDKGESENYETHTYAIVDMKKKKTEKLKIHGSTSTQEVCTPGSDGGTPPPVPPYTPEIFSDPNVRHDERL